MKAAFPVWNNRIAPVFDVTREVRLVEAESGRIVREKDESLPDEPTAVKAIRLAELGVQELICGAISRPLHAMVTAYGIRVIPFVAGDLREILRAWLTGQLGDGVFSMPGCRGRGRRRFHGFHRFGKEERLMNESNRGGMNRGGGQGGGGGQGRGGGRGGGRRGGSSAGGSGGSCVCPQCGHREPHARGVPCYQQQCPKCQTAMTRE
jgi:predicted Fe-Mo cluster-binding NifX family protein